MSIEGRPERASSLRAIHEALDQGLTLIDTADAYNRDAGETGHNEELVAEGLRTWGGDASAVLVATKGGLIRPGDGSWLRNGRPEYLKRAAKESARRLGVEAIGLYQFHRADPYVAFADSVGALVELLDEGVIRMAGISNVDPIMIDVAQDVLGGRLASVQNQFSPFHTASVREVERCAELGIAFLAYRPLGGIGMAGRLGERFGVFAQVAARHEVSPQRVALAWALRHSEAVIPIPGASRPETIRDSAHALQVSLTEEDLALLNGAVWLEA